jgi:signal transduction protein with GAF and PtsI domain
MNTEARPSSSQQSRWKEKEYTYKNGNHLPIPLGEALAEVEETAELIHAEVEEIADLLHQQLALTDTVSASVLQNLLYQLLTCIHQVMNVDTVAVLLPTKDGQKLAVCATIGLEEEITEGIRIPIRRGFAGCIAASCELTIVSDLSTVEVVSPILRTKGLQSMLGVPLLVQDRVIGVFHVGTFRRRQFTRDDAQLLRLVADHVGLAIDRLEILKPSKDLCGDRQCHTQSVSIKIPGFICGDSLTPDPRPLIPLVMTKCRAFFYHFKNCQMARGIILSA